MESANDLQENPSIECAFEAEAVPAWPETITMRSVAVSMVLGTMLSIVAMKLNFTSGFLPSLSIPAGLLGFFLSQAWIRVLNQCEIPHLPFTRQENAVIQTCVVACSSIAFSGGFGTYIPAMSKKLSNANVGSDNMNIDEPSIGRLIAFLFLVTFAGLFVIMPLSKTMIIQHQLTFPSGTATAHLINSFHTPHGVKQARQQVSVLFKSFGGTILWSLFQWFFAAGKDCGFQAFPTFGLKAYQHGFYFDFSMANIGIGMICPYKIIISMLVGSVMSWGIMWPYIMTKEGYWYPRNLDPNSLSGIKGYKVFIGVSMILADGLFNLVYILLQTMYTMYKQQCTKTMQSEQPFQYLDITERPAKSFDDRRRAQVFLRDQIPNSVSIGGYILLCVISTIAIPPIYPQLKHHYIALTYLAAPIFAFCNAYGMGITEMNLSSTYGKIAMLVFGSWVGHEDGGVVAGLVVCGIIMVTVSIATDFMQDFKTGYLTLTSPRAMFISQVIGTVLGCVINPVVFWIFYKVHSTKPNEIIDIPYAKVYRGIMMLGIGQHGLPKYSMLLSRLFFALALALSVLREVANKKEWCIRHYIPSTVGMAVAFFVSPNMPIGICLGSLMLFLWERVDSCGARQLSPAVASGLICGDGIGSLLSSMLTLFRAQAPICIRFLSRVDNDMVDAFLATVK